jgi:hypothetical protein
MVRNFGKQKSKGFIKSTNDYLFRHPLQLVVVIALIVGAHFMFRAAAEVQNNGYEFYGYSTTAGETEVKDYTWGSDTFGSLINGPAATSSSAVKNMVSKVSPTRKEVLVGQQRTDMGLDIQMCVNSCSTGTDMSTLWTLAADGPASTTSSVFDIAYEQLTGRAMVVYGNNVTGKVYYCLYDGSTWGPVSNCAPTDGVNSISLNDGTTSLSGTPVWVRLKARGDQFGAVRTNDIMLAVQDNNADVYVTRWDGSAWSTSDDIVANLNAGTTFRTWDIGWETLSGNEVIAYKDTSPSTGMYYRTSSGSGWGSATNINTLAAPNQITMASDPLSNRVAAFSITSTAATSTRAIWKSDGSTAGWTTDSSVSATWDTQGYAVNDSVAWEKAHSGTPKVLFVTAGPTNSGWSWNSSTWISGTGFSAFATGSGCSALSTGQSLTPSANDDSINLDFNKCSARYTDTWTAGSTVDANMLASGSGGEIRPRTFSFKPYAAWGLNWRFYDDESTAGTPTSPLKPEGISPTVTNSNIVRLRYNFKEVGGMGENNVRKKLQYSSGAGCPDGSGCTWTDVDAQGGAGLWRYASGGLSDTASLAGNVLTGTDSNGYAFTNGISTTTAAQSAGTTQEYDFTIQNNGAGTTTPYFFRAYDYGPSIASGSNTNLNSIPRYQYTDVSGTEQTPCTKNNLAISCTYPAINQNTAPQTPTLLAPAASATQISLKPTLQLRSTDQELDYIEYKINFYQSNCSTLMHTIDMTSLPQTGWFGQDANSGAAYAGDTNIVNSTLANFSYYFGDLQPSTGYCWSAAAIDPGGKNVFGTTSSTQTFTTAAADVRIGSGTTINSGVTIH